MLFQVIAQHHWIINVFDIYRSLCIFRFILLLVEYKHVSSLMQIFNITTLGIPWILDKILPPIRGHFSYMTLLISLLMHPTVWFLVQVEYNVFIHQLTLTLIIWAQNIINMYIFIISVHLVFILFRINPFSTLMRLFDLICLPIYAYARRIFSTRQYARLDFAPLVVLLFFILLHIVTSLPRLFFDA